MRWARPRALLFSFAIAFVLASVLSYRLHALEGINAVGTLALVVLLTLVGAGSLYGVALMAGREEQELEQEEERERQGLLSGGPDPAGGPPEGTPLPSGVRDDAPLPSGRRP